MKTLVLLGLLASVCLLAPNSAAPLAPGMVHEKGCCLSFRRTPVPQEKVKHVAMEPSNCKHIAIIITAVSGKKFCTDPTWSWAQKQLEAFQKSLKP